MLLDSKILLSDQQAITVDAPSTNAYDLGGANRDVGNGTPLRIVLVVDETFLTLTSLIISIVSDDAAALTSPTKLSSKTILAAALTAGAVIDLGPIPSGIAERYIGLDYDVTGSSATAGKVTAAVVTSVSRNVPTSDD